MPIIKAIHLIAIALSVLLFITRYAMMMTDSARLKTKFFKVYPHFNDTILLLSGVILVLMTGKIPFTEEGIIVTQKLTCVLVYIALGFVTLKIGRNKLIRTVAFLGALGWIYWAYRLATTQVPMW